MASYQVVCVNYELSRDGTHQHISHLGLGQGNRWQTRVTVAEAIKQLRSPIGDRYFTISPTAGRHPNVIEAAEGCRVCSHRPYVKTDADGIRDDNLGALSRCVTS